MKATEYLLIALISLSLSACTTTKPLTSSVKPDKVIDLMYLEPFSYISLIESGNRGKYNDSISQQSKKLLRNVVKNFKDEIPIYGDISVTDTMIKNTLENEIEFLCLSAERLKNLSGLKITPVIDSLIEETGKRFGLITVSRGFTRIKGNYSKEIAKGAAMGILTLGMYYQTPIKANSTIYAMIVDTKENNIAFFRRSYLQDMDPLDEKVVTKQFRKIFEGYFWTKNK